MDEPVLSAEQVTAIIDAMKDRAIIDTEKALLAFSYEDLNAIRRDLEERLVGKTAERDAFLAACTGAEGEPDPLEAVDRLIALALSVSPGNAQWPPVVAAESLLARLREACEKVRGAG